MIVDNSTWFTWSSSEWDWVRKQEKQAIELKKDDDGEFWYKYLI